MITHEHKVSIEITVSADPGTKITSIPPLDPTPHLAPSKVRTEEDPWKEAVSLYLRGKKEVSNLEIGYECLKLDPVHHNRSTQIRIANILKSLSWKKKGVMINGRFASRWFSPVREEMPPTDPYLYAQ